MKLFFFHVGAKNPKWVDEVLSDFDKRLSKSFKIQRILIKSPTIDRDNAKLKIKKETAAILRAVGDMDSLILLDEKGRGIKSSREFSDIFKKLSESGATKVGFLIGGAYGVSDEVRAKANQTWRLSELTFNHQLAQVVLAEQIYRAFSIIKGLPYHND